MVNFIKLIGNKIQLLV